MNRRVFLGLGARVNTLVLLAIAGTANAQLASFSTTSDNGDETSQAATTIATGVASGSTLTRSSGLVATTAGGSLNSNTWISTNGQTNTFATGRYYTFVLTPTANYSLSFTGVTGGVRSSGTGPNNAQWAYSIDSFAGLGTATTPSTTATTTLAATLSNTGVTTATEFRLVGWRTTTGGQTGGTMRIITPSVTGSATLRSAGTLVWDGGQASANWSGYTAAAANQSNWNANNIPLSGDALQFAGTTQTTTANDIAGLTVASITFNSGAGAFTNGGPNAVTLTGGITNSSSNLQTINHGVALGAGAHTIDTTGSSVALGGVLFGSGSLNKLGSNGLTLSRANTYTGGTTVGAGALFIGNASGSSATGTGAVTVNNGGTLLGTGYIVANNTTNPGTTDRINVQGIVSPGGTSPTANTAGTINLAATGGLTLEATSTLSFDITSTTDKDLVALSATALILNGGTLALNLPNATATGIDYTATYSLFTGVSSLSGAFGTVTGYDSTDYVPMFMLNGSTYELSFSSVAVPEPATYFSSFLLIGIATWMKHRTLSNIVSAVLLRVG